MANYVKFMRGSLVAYEKLSPKDSDTLYFLSDSTSSEGYIYLGTKLISGPNTTSSGGTAQDIYLKDLEDVLIAENINTDALLVYDPSEGAWVSTSFESLVFQGASRENGGLPGLVPAPATGEQNYFLRGDGTWTSIGSIGDTQIFEIIPTTEETHEQALSRVTADIIINSGDIAIIKDFIALAEDDISKYQYTSYVYDYNISKWVAMDGNYNAENVYFKTDFVFTEPVGGIIIPESGSTEVAAAGKNIKQFVESLFSVEKLPEVIDPVISIETPQNTLYEIGTLVTPTYKGNLDDAGSYTYGPATGITVTGWQAIDSNGEILLGQEGSFNPIIITEDTNYTITVQANLSDGVIPVTNLNNPCEEKQFKSTIISVTSNALNGYRKSFWGTYNAKQDELTSDDIRNLTSSSENYLDDGSEFDLDIPIDAMRVIIAYPASLRDLTYVLDVNDHANIVSGFTKSIIKVDGAPRENDNTDYSIDYKVYTMDFARPYGIVNKFKVII